MSDMQHVNHEVLADLREIMAGEFNRLIETYITDSHLRLSQLQRALVVADYDGVRQAAHSFKGSCSNIGAARLVQLCQVLEEAASIKQLEGLEHQLVELHAEFQRVQYQLEAYR